jgi:hypothetical protein
MSDDLASERPVTLMAALQIAIRDELIPDHAMARLRSDLQSAARMTGIALDELPCDPCQLRPILQRVLPARFARNMRARAHANGELVGTSSKKRWSNSRASIGRLLRATFWLDPREGCKAGLTPAWRVLVDRLTRGGQKGSLGAFARFCLRQDITPADVTAATLQAYCTWLETRTLEPAPRRSGSVVRALWNRVIADDPALARHTLASPRDPRAVALPIHQLHPDFVATVEAHLDRLAHPGPFDAAVSRKLAPATIKARRQILLASASVLIAGGLPADALRSLADLLQPDRLRQVMEAHYFRVGKGAWAPSVKLVATHLKLAARQCGLLSPQAVQAVEALANQVKAHKPGLSSKSRARVAQFDDPEILRALLELPGTCYRAADRMHAEGDSLAAARLHETALAIDILIAKPLRLDNLVTLSPERHLRLAGGKGPDTLSLPTSKATHEIVAALPKPLARRIQNHVQLYRPLLRSGAKDGFLFPGAAGGAITPCNLASRMKRLVETQIGCNYNAHMIRHLVVTMLLDADPRNMPLAQRVLDHSCLKSTERWYGVQRSRGAQTEWMAMLDRKVRALRS